MTDFEAHKRQASTRIYKEANSAECEEIYVRRGGCYHESSGTSKKGVRKYPRENGNNRPKVGVTITFSISNSSRMSP